jgi:hypothetical protein
LIKEKALSDPGLI